MLQALLRNPLATPFTLGVSAGAALGAMLAITFSSISALLGVSSVPIASFVGSMVAIAIVYWLATPQQRGLSTNVLLLAGVTLNSFFSALILFVQYLADFTAVVPHGALADGRSRRRQLRPDRGGAAAASLLAFAAFAVLPRTLNLLTLGNDVAAARGVDVARAAAPRVLQCVAGHRRRGVAGRSRSASSASWCRTWCG